MLYLISTQTLPTSHPSGSRLIPCCSLDIQATSRPETWASLFPSVSVLDLGGWGVVRDWNLWQTTTNIPAPPTLNLILIATHLLTQWNHRKPIFSSPLSLSSCDGKIEMNGSMLDLKAPDCTLGSKEQKERRKRGVGDGVFKQSRFTLTNVGYMEMNYNTEAYQTFVLIILTLWYITYLWESEKTRHLKTSHWALCFKQIIDIFCPRRSPSASSKLNRAGQLFCHLVHEKVTQSFPPQTAAASNF